MGPLGKAVVPAWESGLWERPPGQWSTLTGAWPQPSLRKPNHPSYARGIRARNQTLASWWIHGDVKWMKGSTANLICHCSLVLSKCNAIKSNQHSLLLFKLKQARTLLQILENIVQRHHVTLQGRKRFRVDDSHASYSKVMLCARRVTSAHTGKWKSHSCRPSVWHLLWCLALRRSPIKMLNEGLTANTY